MSDYKSFAAPEKPRCLSTDNENAPDLLVSADLHDENWISEPGLAAETAMTENDPAETSGEEVKPESEFESDTLGTGGNPTALYLQDVRSIPLLGRERELMLARQIEQGQNQIVEEALSSPLALGWTLGLSDKVAAGRVSLRDVVKIPIGASGELDVD